MTKFRFIRKDGEQEYVEQLEQELRFFKGIVKAMLVLVLVVMILLAVSALGSVLGAPTTAVGLLLGLGLSGVLA